MFYISYIYYEDIIRLENKKVINVVRKIVILLFFLMFICLLFILIKDIFFF